MKLASFDIFDTALLRKCGTPDGVAYLMSRRLFNHDPAAGQDFLRQRLLRGEPLPEMMEEEKAMEAEVLVANPRVKKLIRERREAGFRICFISDMHLPSAFLADVLRREGMLLEGERVYVSCECGCRKDTGGLYEYVRRELRPEAWEHYGDHLPSDVRQARRHGIEAHHLPTPFTPAERRQMAYRGPGWRDVHLLVGLQRVARLLSDDPQRAELAADFLAAMFVPYLIYIRTRAQELGLTTLHFLSRDAYVLHRMAEQLMPGLSLRYLFLSRHALHLPYLRTDARERYLDIMQCRGTIRALPRAEVLKPLHLTHEEAQTRHGIDLAPHPARTEKAEQRTLKQLFESPTLTADLSARAQLEGQLMDAYLEQEGLMDSPRAAIVDVGWLGTGRLMLSRIMGDAGAKALPFFYFGVRRDVLPFACGPYETYLEPADVPRELTWLVEHYLCASPWPTLRGFRREGTDVVPRFMAGEAYAHTPLTQTNERVGVWMAREVAHLGIELSPAALWQWAHEAIESLSTLSVDLPLEPLTQSGACDAHGADADTAFARRLRPKELLSLVCLGQRITAFDRASLRLSVPRALERSLWRIHQRTERLRTRIYNKLNR